MKVLMTKEFLTENSFVEKVWEVYHYFRHTLPERISRSFAYARFGWLNYDFDYSCIHELLLFKLKRMVYVFETYGYHSEECSNYPPKMKSIKLTIKLLEKYCNNDYSRFLDMHEKKWGPRTVKHIPVDALGNIVPREEAKYFRFKTSHKNAVTDAEIKQEREEFLKAYDKDEREKEKHLRWAYEIITKYHRYWWD